MNCARDGDCHRTTDGFDNAGLTSDDETRRPAFRSQFSTIPARTATLVAVLAVFAAINAAAGPAHAGTATSHVPWILHALSGTGLAQQENGPTDNGQPPENGEPATAEATQTPAQPLETSVTTLSRDVEIIRLVKGQSAMLRSNVSIIRAAVSNEEVADLPTPPSPRELIVTGIEYGTTQLTIWTEDGQRKTFEIVVEIDLPMLNDALRRLAPHAQVEARMLSGTLILTGRVPDLLTAERIQNLALIMHPRVVNHMDVGGLQQALLRCTVAEVNRQAVRELNMNWAIGGSDWTRDFFFANNLGNLNPTTFTDTGVFNLDPRIAPLLPLGVVPNMNLPNSLGGQLYYNRLPTANLPTTNMTFGFPRAEFQMFVNALRENNLFRILAEPNVVAVNGQEASFLSGGEFPIPVTQGGAVAGSITIEYREFGIRLGFVPTILDNNIVRMRVMAEVSDLIPATGGVAGGLPVFSLSTRRVESTVEVGNGQTFAVGGLLSERVQALASKLPGLGDIPVLGTLFSSVQYQRNETELVILVTPELVMPLDPHQVPPVPGADMTTPTDYELFFEQKLEGKPRAEPARVGAPRYRQPTRVRPAAEPPESDDLTLRGPWGISDFDE